MFCPKCGVQAPDTAMYCMSCGAALESVVSPNELPLDNTSASAELNAAIDRGFGLALASAICASFPIASIVAIVLGSRAGRLYTKAHSISAELGLRLPGKGIPTRVLSLIGRIVGIIMTVVYAIYITAMLALFAL